MKKTLTTLIGIAFIAAPAFALADDSAGVSASTSVNLENRVQVVEQRRAEAASTSAASRETARTDAISSAKERAGQEIQRRIGNLEKSLARVSGMKRLSDSDKAALSSSLQGEISALTTLDATIANDTATTSLRADIQSITKSYRVYALVLPRAALTAAADRVLSVAAQLSALESKLSARIAAAPAGTDVASLQSTLADMQGNIENAKTQANAAISEAAALTPDNGAPAAAAANASALKDARSKVQAGQQYIVVARKDAENIVKGIRGRGGEGVVATTSAAASTTAQ